MANMITIIKLTIILIKVLVTLTMFVSPCILYYRGDISLSLMLFIYILIINTLHSNYELGKALELLKGK